jgi:excisionase family DNA binding protein
MITVQEAARRVGRNSETVRRWIREGRLRARKIGRQHVIEEDDLATILGDVNPETSELPQTVMATTGTTATDALLAERRTDRR